MDSPRDKKNIDLLSIFIWCGSQYEAIFGRSVSELQTTN